MPLIKNDSYRMAWHRRRQCASALPTGAQAPNFLLQGAQAENRKVLIAPGAAKKAGSSYPSWRLLPGHVPPGRRMVSKPGVSAGSVDHVAEFTKLECRDKFTVAADSGVKVAALNQTWVEMTGKNVDNRTSYIIAPAGKFLQSYTGSYPERLSRKP